MTLHETQIASAALLLHDAERDRRPISPIVESYSGVDLAAAYAIQQANLARRLAAGASVRGHKIGFTALAMRELLGVEEPDFGYILDDMIVPDDDSVPASRFCMPRVEPEIAFLLHSPLRGPGVTVADVLAATEAVAPALEIIDSRIVDWRITLEDTVADNASAAAVVIGPWTTLSAAPPLPDVRANLLRNGELIGSGTGHDVMGDPALAIAWLANALSDFDIEIEAGQFVMSGSFTTAAFVYAGDRAQADLRGLGTVAVNFT
ncbi:2-keto-4-pentenoate hydratase [Antrihabitans sp. YC2-6]|uniref:2-keto-4-pentenoate hydratase n=1 Tax=Antrihabitans sp. YC2-6 TaxID=2799498 RepID=UPI0018F7BDC0|nr:fumarylacetoacetate hydrolase family protein [Antrihabitans sp. YC2-6]MBJ8347238.1 fumarylacetoacetate hydrolase family protein [Antrihabitans sp. YC2-6]